MEDLEQLLYDHRQGALTCYNHDHVGYCCVCGEHNTTSFRAHMAEVLQKRIDDLTPTLDVGMKIHGFASGFFGRDSYACRTIEAKGSDWFVTRNDVGVVELITKADADRIDPDYLSPNPELCGC